MEVWKTEDPRHARVDFVMREALFEIYTWICLYEKQKNRILSFIKIVPF